MRDLKASMKCSSIGLDFSRGSVAAGMLVDQQICQWVNFFFTHAALQLSQTKAVRVGSAPASKAKYVALVGVGKVENLASAATWGHSWAQVVPGGILGLSNMRRVSTGLKFDLVVRLAPVAICLSMMRTP